MKWRIAGLFLLVTCCEWTGIGAAEKLDVQSLVTQINAVGPQGKGHRDATAAWRKLAQAEVEQIPEILAGVEAKNVLATNWIRAAVESIVDRSKRAGTAFPRAALEKFISETGHAPRARRLAYELILDSDPLAEERLAAGLLDDPSIELRRDAINVAWRAATKMEEGGDTAGALSAYRNVLRNARDVDQVKQAAEKLRALKDSVDLPSHFGFIMDWQLVGPFDNRNKSGFDKAYPPEGGVDLKATYDGQDEKVVGWISHRTADDFGIVDLNKALDKHKGAVVYAYHEFEAERPQTVDLRIGSTNANKIWLNGALLTSNHVYHAGRDVDQYVAQGKLKAGKNQILVKIAQNEQTEPWAQDWQFQLRVCDAIGTAVLARNRKPMIGTQSGG